MFALSGNKDLTVYLKLSGGEEGARRVWDLLIRRWRKAVVKMVGVEEKRVVMKPSWQERKQDRSSRIALITVGGFYAMV